MNVREAYRCANEVLVTLAHRPPIPIPDHGTDYEKVQFLLDEYAKQLKRQFWWYRLFCNNRRIPELICEYLGNMLDEEDKRKPNKAF